MAKNKFVKDRGYSQADWDEVADSPEITAREFAQAKPFGEVLPQFAEALKGRGKQRAPTKELISLRLSRAVIARFRALGPGWQTRIDEVLTKAAQEL